MIELTSITCRAKFGDERCKMPLRWYAGTVNVVGAETDRVFTCATTPGSGTAPGNAATNVAIGTGDGTTKAFQLKDNGGASVTAGFAVTAIKVDGVALASGAYSVSTAGIATLTTAPAVGKSVTWTGTYANTIGAVSAVPFFQGDGSTKIAGLTDTSGDRVRSGFTVTAIKVAGTALAGGDYSVSSDGVVTFVTAPATGAQCTWDGTVTLQPSGYWSPGVVHWDTGANAGQESEVESYAADTGTITLSIPMRSTIAAGDTFRIRRDCAYSKAMCKDYGNLLNFRGEPELPRANGTDLQAPTPK